jgi:DNA-binding MarR family transcriptional regulator
MMHDNLSHQASTERGGGPIDTIDSSWVDQQIGYLLRRASAAMSADYAAAAGPGALRPVQVSMLSVVGANPGIGQSELGATLGIQRTNVAPLVVQLTESGLLDRRPSPTDGRRVELHLTDAGREALDAGRELIADHEARSTRGLSDADRDQLRALLRRLVP